MTNTWDANHYDSSHSYVWTLAADLIEVLAPQPGERVLDLGCGTGHLTAKIAERGATVVGIDASVEMVRQARANYPELEFRVGDATSFEVDRSFDAVFSNATLHWVEDARAVARRVAAALRPGGRFVAEFGGAGNVRYVCRAIAAGLAAVGGPAFESLSPWHFRGIAEYAAVLEGAGLEVTLATLFDRPTVVEAGLRSWLEMYGTVFLEAVGEARREPFIAAVEAAAARPYSRRGSG